MKNQLILSVLLAATVAQATVYDSGTQTVGAVIPDNNPSGLVSSFSFSTGDANTINGVSVTLDISGGYNGDYYGYLVNPNGSIAVLLNRVGTGSGNATQQLFGYSNSGMNVNLSDVGMPGASSVAGNIHSYQMVGGYDISTGTTAWSPDNGPGNFSALYNGGGRRTMDAVPVGLIGGRSGNTGELEFERVGGAGAHHLGIGCLWWLVRGYHGGPPYIRCENQQGAINLVGSVAWVVYRVH